MLHSHGSNQAIARSSKVEILAKFYLESDPTQISDVAIAELYDWIFIDF